MPSSKKPRKPYVPKSTLLPLNMKRAVKGELPLHLAWDALGTGDLDFHHIAEFTAHAALLYRVSPLREMKAKGSQLYYLCQAILERYQAVGRLGVSGAEMVAIKEILEVTIPYARTLPNDQIHRAVKGGR